MATKQTRKQEIVRLIDEIFEIVNATQKLAQLGFSPDHIIMRSLIKAYILDIAILFENNAKGVKIEEFIGVQRADQLRHKYKIVDVRQIRDSFVAHGDLDIYDEKSIKCKKVMDSLYRIKNNTELYFLVDLKILREEIVI